MKLMNINIMKSILRISKMQVNSLSLEISLLPNSIGTINLGKILWLSPFMDEKNQNNAGNYNLLVKLLKRKARLK